MQTFPHLLPATGTGWHHYVLTLTAAGIMTVYVDGQAISTHTDPAVTTSVGAGYAIGAGTGGFDDAAIYGTALSAERVREHWFRGATRSEDGPCPAEEPAPPADAHGQAVLAHDPLIFLRPGDAPHTAGERVARDHSGGCHHGAVSPRHGADRGRGHRRRDGGRRPPDR